MRRSRRPPAALLDALGALSALDAARAVARDSAEFRGVLPETPLARARLLVDLYEWLKALRSGRKGQGLFYTPAGIVEAMLDRVPLTGTILDPAAGAGAFLVGVAARCGPEVLPRLFACDVDGDALEAGALALELLLGHGHRDEIARWRETNTLVADALIDPLPFRPMSLVLGNPPYRRSAAPALARAFPELRGEKDLFACFLLKAGELLEPDGVAALLVPDSWLTNRHALGLREALLARTPPRAIFDFGKPFAFARDTQVHAVLLDRRTRRCEVRRVEEGREVVLASPDLAELRSTAARGWYLYRTPAEQRAVEAMESLGERLSKRFEVIYGLKTGSNAVHLAPGPGEVPVVGGADLGAYDRRPPVRHLVRPEAFVRGVARQRGRPKVALQRIRSNARASWRRWLEAACCGPNEVGLDSLTLVASREGGEAAEAALIGLLGVLNSSLLNRWFKLTFTDVNVKPAYVVDLPVPRAFSASLVRLVQRRLESAGPVPLLERAIDRLVAEAYGLDTAAIEVFEAGFWGAELLLRPLPSLEEALALAGAEG